MSQTLKLNFVVTAAIAVAGLLTMQAVDNHSKELGGRQFSERVNLALRQTAHRLLSIAGDRTSKIPPVQRAEGNSWLIRLEQHFDYDSLPPVLQEAFALHSIEGDYNVAVLDCSSDDLMLGYTASLLIADKEIPCRGREQTVGCYNLRVTFVDRAAIPFQEKGIWIFLAAVCLAMLTYSAYGLFNFLKKKRLAEKISPSDDDRYSGMTFSKEAGNGQAVLQFGQSILHIDNQKLVSNGIEKDLTYRETKLLQLFCRHTNQLLERDLILKSVWEDEGIIVGRSVDVFVSRLRKLLKDDETVKITNVHGVGYRLEIQ